MISWQVFEETPPRPERCLVISSRADPRFTGLLYEKRYIVRRTNTLFSAKTLCLYMPLSFLVTCASIPLEKLGAELRPRVVALGGGCFGRRACACVCAAGGRCRSASPGGATSGDSSSPLRLMETRGIDRGWQDGLRPPCDTAVRRLPPHRCTAADRRLPPTPTSRRNSLPPRISHGAMQHIAAVLIIVDLF